MNKKTPPDQPRQAYVLRASIAESRPRIWRELSVPGDYTLGDLHIVLQIAFKWGNAHLHSFTVNSTEYGIKEIEDMGFDDDHNIVDEDTVCLNHLGLRPEQKFEYLYDFGDSWLHEIRVSKIIPIGAEDRDLAWPHCLEGERAGPLEDSGGIWGYMEMLEVLQNPAHAEYQEIHEWMGDVDPEYFNREEINAHLERAFKPQSPKAKKKPV
jgi:hypothetical protein